MNENTDVWLFEIGRGALRPFTFDPFDDVFPIWSPDSRHIVFSSNRDGGTQNLYLKTVTAGSEHLLLSTQQTKFASDWSSDGRFLLYQSQDPKKSYDIWAAPLDGTGKAGEPFEVVRTDFEERDGQFSPDGKWIAYQSNESGGRFEIYVQAFPGHGGKLQITTAGGAQVRWRRDGNELYYIALDGRLMAVPIRHGFDGRTLDADALLRLFQTQVGGAVQSNFRQQYMLSPDGLRFLMNTIPEDAAPPLLLSFSIGSLNPDSIRFLRRCSA